MGTVAFLTNTSHGTTSPELKRASSSTCSASLPTKWNGNERVRKFTFKKSLGYEIKKWWGDIFETEIKPAYGDNIKYLVLIILNDDGTDSGKCIHVKDIDEHYETSWECDRVMRKAGIPKSFTAEIARPPYGREGYTYNKIPNLTFCDK